MLFARGKRSWKTFSIVLVALLAGLLLYTRQFHPEAEDIAGQRAQLAQRARAPALATVDTRSLLADVRTLAAPAMEGRGVGTPGGARARAYIAARYAALGLQPAHGNSFEQRFTYTPERGVRFWRSKFWQAPQPLSGVNLIGRIAGTAEPGKYLLVTAHYDHLGIRDGRLYPGSDDNASGVAAMLAVARHFRAHPPRHSLLFVAFDGEEAGHGGSRFFVDQPPVPLSAMALDINLDMVSRSTVGELFVSGLHANPQLRELVDPVRATAAVTMLYGHDHPRPFWNGDDWTQQSDQAAFADRDIPFLYLGVEDHPDYHQPGDTFEHLDQEFFASAARTIVALVAALDATGSPRLARQP